MSKRAGEKRLNLRQQPPNTHVGYCWGDSAKTLWFLCNDCGCPMLPIGEVKRPNEYDHALGCPSGPDIVTVVCPCCTSSFAISDDDMEVTCPECGAMFDSPKKIEGESAEVER